MTKFAASAAIGFTFMMLISAALWSWNLKYDMCMDAGHSRAACTVFAGTR